MGCTSRGEKGGRGVGGSYGGVSMYSTVLLQQLYAWHYKKPKFSKTHIADTLMNTLTSRGWLIGIVVWFCVHPTGNLPPPLSLLPLPISLSPPSPVICRTTQTNKSYLKPVYVHMPWHATSCLCCMLTRAEPVFLNVYGAQESIPRNEFRQPM